MGIHYRAIECGWRFQNSAASFFFFSISLKRKKNGKFLVRRQLLICQEEVGTKEREAGSLDDEIIQKGISYSEPEQGMHANAHTHGGGRFFLPISCEIVWRRREAGCQYACARVQASFLSPGLAWHPFIAIFFFFWPRLAQKVMERRESLRRSVKCSLVPCLPIGCVFFFFFFLFYIKYI